MKSKRAEEFIGNNAFNAIQLPGEIMYSVHKNKYGGLLKRKDVNKAVELAEQEIEEDIIRYCKDLEESKKREELARKVIGDQRKEIEKLKERAAEAFKDYMIQNHGGYLSSDLNDFIQTLNER